MCRMIGDTWLYSRSYISRPLSHSSAFPLSPLTMWVPPLPTTFVIANYDTSLVSACLLGSTQYSVSSFPADDSRVCMSAWLSTADRLWALSWQTLRNCCFFTLSLRSRRIIPRAIWSLTMDIPRNATPGPSSLPMQPSRSGLHTAQPDPQIGPTGPVQRIAQSDSAQSSLAQSDNRSVSVNMNSNTASSSVVSLPPDTGRYHILPPSHVQSFTNHPLPPSPPRFAAYMRRDPLLPSPSPPPRLSAPIWRDTPPHLHTPLPTYTGPQVR